MVVVEVVGLVELALRPHVGTEEEEVVVVVVEVTGLVKVPKFFVKFMCNFVSIMFKVSATSSRGSRGGRGGSVSRRGGAAVGIDRV